MVLLQPACCPRVIQGQIRKALLPATSLSTIPAPFLHPVGSGYSQTSGRRSLSSHETKSLRVTSTSLDHTTSRYTQTPQHEPLFRDEPQITLAQKRKHAACPPYAMLRLLDIFQPVDQLSDVAHLVWEENRLRIEQHLRASTPDDGAVFFVWRNALVCDGLSGALEVMSSSNLENLPLWAICHTLQLVDYVRKGYKRDWFFKVRKDQHLITAVEAILNFIRKHHVCQHRLDRSTTSQPIFRTIAPEEKTVLISGIFVALFSSSLPIFSMRKLVDQLLSTALDIPADWKQSDLNAYLHHMDDSLPKKFRRFPILWSSQSQQLTDFQQSLIALALPPLLNPLPITPLYNPTRPLSTIVETDSPLPSHLSSPAPKSLAPNSTSATDLPSTASSQSPNHLQPSSIVHSLGLYPFASYKSQLSPDKAEALRLKRAVLRNRAPIIPPHDPSTLKHQSLTGKNADEIINRLRKEYEKRDGDEGPWKTIKYLDFCIRDLALHGAIDKLPEAVSLGLSQPLPPFLSERSRIKTLKQLGAAIIGRMRIFTNNDKANSAIVSDQIHKVMDYLGRHQIMLTRNELGMLKRSTWPPVRTKQLDEGRNVNHAEYRSLLHEIKLIQNRRIKEAFILQFLRREDLNPIPKANFVTYCFMRIAASSSESTEDKERFFTLFTSAILEYSSSVTHAERVVFFKKLIESNTLSTSTKHFRFGSVASTKMVAHFIDILKLLDTDGIPWSRSLTGAARNLMLSRNVATVSSEEIRKLALSQMVQTSRHDVFAFIWKHFRSGLVDVSKKNKMLDLAEWRSQTRMDDDVDFHKS